MVLEIELGFHLEQDVYEVGLFRFLHKYYCKI